MTPQCVRSLPESTHQQPGDRSMKSFRFPPLSGSLPFARGGLGWGKLTQPPEKTPLSPPLPTCHYQYLLE
ncbi:MAG: hypothetical protein VKJ46_04400 [Leptolyngbyaceae bacterium]|nr:hypothetical protein [Leptolyngbyaceae bacterium]